MPATETIRIRRTSRERIDEIVRESGQSIQDIVDEALELYRRTRILELANASYERLRQDPAAWAEELEERELWETTLADGLDEEWFDGPSG